MRSYNRYRVRLRYWFAEAKSHRRNGWRFSIRRWRWERKCMFCNVGTEYIEGIGFTNRDSTCSDTCEPPF